MEIGEHISYAQRALEAFCQKHRIRKLSFFGSVLGSDFGAESDVDVLVEFEPATTVGLVRLGAMELELSALVGRRADMRTAADLSPYFRQQVLSCAQVQYEA